MAKNKHRPMSKQGLINKHMLTKKLESEATQTMIEEQSRRNTERAMWCAVIALNDEFGFGGQRATRFLLRLAEISQEYANMRVEVDQEYGDEKLRLAVNRVTNTDIPELYSSNKKEN